MQQEVLNNIYIMVDQYVYEEQLNTLIKTYIDNKNHDLGVWSDMTLTIHNMLGGTSPNIYQLAATTELIILASDIVDDLQDQDHLNKPWMMDPPAYTLNAVVAMLVTFFAQLSQLLEGNNQAALHEASRILLRSLNGQQKDLSNSTQTVDEYLEMVQEKSGSLMRLACYLGYATLDCSEETINRLNDLADCTGLIHQIENDMRDTLAFDVKSDLVLKKKNLPLLYLSLTESESVIDELLSMDRADAIKLINDSGCVEYCKIVQSLCLTKAQEIYEELQAESPWKEEFWEMMLGSFDQG